MDHVLAKIKATGKKKIFKLLSDKTLFDNVTTNLNSCVAYNPDHNLDEDSWFKIEQFSETKYCLEFLKIDFVVTEYDDLPKPQFVQIAYLCAVQNGNFFFQKITPSQFLTRKMIAFGEAAALEKSDKRLVINKQPDAIYLKDSDALVFRNLATISSVFKGVDELYKEATDEEVVQFLKEPFVKPQDDFSSSKVSKPNRKRIALAMNTLASMQDKERKEIFSYINEYCSENLRIDKKLHTVQVSTDEELKLLLYGIEQRFYTTPVNKVKRIANSVQPMPKPLLQPRPKGDAQSTPNLVKT